MFISYLNKCQYKIFFKYIGIVLAISMLFLINFVNISNPILEKHSFRQTQTAISSYYLSIDGFIWNYITPVLGYPWAIPFEFPIYQLIVSLTSYAFNTNIDATGRAVSFAFLFASFFIVNKILKEFDIHRFDRIIVLNYILLMPFYMFWAATFLIESTALFFTLLFIYFYIKIKLNLFQYRYYFYMSIFLCAALLQKVTTILVPFLGLCCVELYLISKDEIIKYFKNKSIYYLFIAIFFAFAPFLIWLSYSNSIKFNHPIAWSLTSDYLSEWNFGSFSEYYRRDFWFAFVVRSSIINSSAGLGIVCILFYFRCVDLVRYKLIITASLIFYAVPFFVFKPLHRIHEYYQFSNVIYLGVAVGLALARLKVIRKNLLFQILPLIVIFLNVFIFFQFYGEKKFAVIDENNNRTLALAKEIRQETSPSFPIVVYGYDWSSELPYYSERKALMIPDWRIRGSEFDNLSVDITKNLDAYLNAKPSVVIFCDEDKYVVEKDIFISIYIYSRKSMNSGCVLYYM